MRVIEPPLGPREVVRETVLPHWTSLIPPVVFAISLLILPLAAGRILHQSELATDVTVVLAIILPLVLTLFVVRMRTNRLIVTNERLIRYCGITDQQIREIPLKSITNVASRHDYIQSLVGSGTLTVDISGDVGTEVFANVPSPDRLVETLLAEIDAYATRQRQGNEKPGERGNPFDELAQLTDLHERGVVDENEFEALRQRLLQRI